MLTRERRPRCILELVLRGPLLVLSRQAWLRHWVETSSVTGRVTRRFVAGQTLEEELAVCEKLNAENIMATLDYLGENVTSIAEAETSRDAYLKALDRIAALKLSATVSIKLTQVGLDLSPEACAENVDALVSRAASIGSRVEFDMESSEYVDRTLALVRAMHARYASVRAVIQAYLYRSEQDIDALSAEGIPVRLCKGAYSEPAGVAFPSKAAVDANYERLMRKLLDAGADPAIASHDEKILEYALEHVRRARMDASRFEFQMLYGVRRDLQRKLAREGFRLRLYVPYGDAWYPYFMRRLAERPANLLFLARNFFRA
jgi:proline dehydrogenase